jgi:hypothetical protein
MRMGLRGSWLLVFAAAAVSACDDPTALESLNRLPIASTPEIANPGSVVTLQLANPSINKNWEFGNGSLRIDRLEGSAWVEVYNASTEYQTGEGYGIRPGERTTRQFAAPSTNGKYRVRFRFLHFPVDRAEEVFVTSNTFTVTDLFPD